MECESKSDTGNNRVTGTISGTLKQHLSNILGKYELEKLQKPAILCTAQMLREVLM